jgi:hypothetical protein
LVDALTFCTVATKSHLAFVRVLAQSLQTHRPGSRLTLLLVDEIEGCFDRASEPFEVVTLRELDPPDALALRMRYGPAQLCFVMKPHILRHLLGRPDVEQVVYLDADILVTGSMGRVSALLRDHPVVLTPHLTRPVAAERNGWFQSHLLRVGTLNGGFVAVARSEAATQFLAWWSERLRRECVHHPRGLWDDQRWLDLSLSVIEGVHSTPDRTLNVAYWNLGERELTGDVDRGVEVGGEPLQFFHFSGFTFESPERLSKHLELWPGADPITSAVAGLARRYRDLLVNAGHAATSKWRYSYATFDNGVAIPEAARDLFARIGRRVKHFADPFDTKGDATFYAWLNAPYDGGPAHPPYLSNLLQHVVAGTASRWQQPCALETGAEYDTLKTVLRAAEHLPRELLAPLSGVLELPSPPASPDPKRAFGEDR